MKTFALKNMSIAKAAVLVTGLVAAVMVATINPAPTAQATPDEGEACTACHTAGGSLTATPDAGTQLPGASYTVALAFTGGTSPNGYWISGTGVDVNNTGLTPAPLTAPTAAGSYTYTVWARSGVVASTTYTITVAAAPTSTTTTTDSPTSTATATDSPSCTATATDSPSCTATATESPTSTATTTESPTSTATTSQSPTSTTTTAPVVVAGVVAAAAVPAVIPVGAPNTGAGGAS